VVEKSKMSSDEPFTSIAPEAGGAFDPEAKRYFGTVFRFAIPR